MSELKEQYFPHIHPFYHRLKRWSRLEFMRSTGCRKFQAGPLSVLECCLPGRFRFPAGKTAAFITDLHWHDTPQYRKILNSLLEVLKQYAPDYLLFGGDMCGDACDMAGLPEVLSSLSSCAVKSFAVGGNWEYGKEWLPGNFWNEFYCNAGITYLENETAADEHLAVSGVMDFSTGKFKLPEAIPGRFNILLSHSPDTVVALDHRAELDEFPLILCGHTHGGQVNLPLLNIPVHIHSRYGNFFAHGEYYHELRPITMMVSAGLGELSFPWRINCRREVIILRSAEY